MKECPNETKYQTFDILFRAIPLMEPLAEELRPKSYFGKGDLVRMT
jgi:hypothetical protein